MPRPSPPRLFAIFARRAHVAIVIKRGPARWTQLVLWDTRTDVFTDGAWLRGRIYEQKCDLSPDGELFVYSAFQGQRLGTSYSDSYTAVSRPPWLHALALWPRHTTYGGGGTFLDDRVLALRGESKPHPDHPPRGLTIAPSPAAAPHRSTGEVPDAEWSGRDQRNRLVFTRSGTIFARTDGVDLALVTFAEQRPDPQPPPEWAKRDLLKF